jgi:hypothetical protein
LAARADGNCAGRRGAESLSIVEPGRDLIGLRGKGCGNEKNSPICLVVRHFEPEEVFELVRAGFPGRYATK